ncbi:uncharacterized protein [Euphorbia lathyris]|uniref:uncharacterized protein isoform X2 n=1 Tax=Euphorbia lathyris TaxID=212925 RepID=UPI0033137B9C
MDSYQQQHHRYMRPPVPPPSSDPHHYLHHQSRPPLPPQAPWYPNHFQYNQPPPPPSSHSPSPPPPQQWAAPPHSDHLSHPPLPPSAYPPPPPPPNPYSSYHPQPGQQFPPPPPRPHLPPPPSHSQITQSYPQVNQEWGNPNCGQHQGWDYQGSHNNVEDWAARARAWATQNAAMEDQNHQSQFTQASGMEEQNRYHDQYQQTPDSHYQDIQQQPYPASGYQQFPVSAAPSQQQPIVYQQENSSLSSGQSSNDSHFSYTVGGGTSYGAPTTSSSVLQQEVPSSYSSVTGKEEATVKMDQPYKSLPLPISSTQEGQHQLPLSGLGGSALAEQSFAYGNQGADLTTDLSNQPLEFASNFGRDHDPHMQTSYGSHHDSAGSVRGHGPVPPLPSINSWAPAVTGAVYPPIPPGHPLGHQHDPSVAVPSVSGHAPPPFGSFPGTSFQPTIPTAGAPYGLGSGTVLLPSTGFPGDAYGISNVTERPKKASVPNWLKEEIIKNASVITRTSLEHPKEETQSIEDEGVEKSSGKGDQADSKSIDSSRSTEEEDEDEDDIEAARTVAINQEIKRILTEVLLKVTDELFDEIATKVLDDDDLTDEVDCSKVTLNDKVSPSPPEVPTPKASAKVLVPVKAKESANEDTSEKSSSSAPGNVLGLANYASDDDDDDDDDDEIKSSTISNSREKNVLQQPSIAKISEGLSDATENGRSPVDNGKNIEEQIDLETEQVKTSNNKSRRQINATTSELSEHKYLSTVVSGTRDVETIVDGSKISHTSNGSGSKATFGEIAIDDSQVRGTKTKLYEDQQHERKRNYYGKEKDIKEAERRSRADEKGDGNHRKQDEKHPRKQKIDDRNSSIEKTKVQGDRTREKVKESDSRKKSSHLDVKEDRKELERLHRSSAKENDDRKRGRGKDKEEDRARHKLTSDSSKHKRRRSSSTSSKGRNSKDNYSSDEASDGSKRRLHSRKRNLSPSPVRSRRRQVSRSPHSKHSQRRHSPYSSIEKTRYVALPYLTLCSTGESIRLENFLLETFPWFNNCTNYSQGKEVKVQITCEATSVIQGMFYRDATMENQ